MSNKKLNNELLNINYYKNNSINFHYMKNAKTFKTISFINNKYKSAVQKNTTANEVLNILNETIDEVIYNLYPFYTISDLKKIIGGLFNLDWYKITLYWYYDDTTHTSYKLYVNNKRYKVLFNNINMEDFYLHLNKNNIKVSSTDELLTMVYFILNDIKDIYFIYFDDYNITNININHVDYMYYNFIIKYFPLFTYELFYNYIFDPKSINHKYNSLVSIGQHLSYYNQLTELLDNTAAKNNKNLNINVIDFNYKELTFTFTNLIICEDVKIRNIFDFLHISDYNILKMIFIYNNKMYRK
jgi:hypothetical protein